MIKMNKKRYFGVSFRYSMVSCGVLGCLGVSWGNKTDRFGLVNFKIFNILPPNVLDSFFEGSQLVLVNRHTFIICTSPNELHPIKKMTVF